jgi:hypothetical protein
LGLTSAWLEIGGYLERAPAEYDELLRVLARQNETPFLRSRRAREIRMRLVAGFSFAEPFPEKPPEMHW